MKSTVRKLVVSFEHAGRRGKLFIGHPVTCSVEARVKAWYPGAKVLFWDWVSDDELAAVSRQRQSASSSEQLPLLGDE